MAEQKSSSALTAPLRGAASALRRVPGAAMVGRAAEETLDKVGAVSPRGRRIAVYAGAGVLGAAGLVEWPVALTGAAVAWLTQPRPAHPADGGNGPGQGPGPAHDLGTASLTSGHGTGESAAEAGGAPSGSAPAPRPAKASRSSRTTGSSRPSAGAEASGGIRTSGGTPTTSRAPSSEDKPSTGPLGPTARPDRTTL